MKNALFFDLDGTLWNALSEITSSYNLTMKKKGLSFIFDGNKIQSIMGLTPSESVPILFGKDFDLNEGIKLFKEIFLDELTYLKEHPGTLYENEIEVLKELKEKYDLFIVSNADKGYIETYLSSNPSLNDLFIDHLCAGDYNEDKKDSILRLKKLYNISNVIYIGDTNKDYIESKKANVKFIHASYGFGKLDEQVNKITSLDELPKLVDTIFNKD